MQPPQCSQYNMQPALIELEEEEEYVQPPFINRNSKDSPNRSTVDEGRVKPWGNRKPKDASRRLTVPARKTEQGEGSSAAKAGRDRYGSVGVGEHNAVHAAASLQLGILKLHDQRLTNAESHSAELRSAEIQAVRQHSTEKQQVQKKQRLAVKGQTGAEREDAVLSAPLVGKMRRPGNDANLRVTVARKAARAQQAAEVAAAANAAKVKAAAMRRADNEAAIKTAVARKAARAKQAAELEAKVVAAPEEADLAAPSVKQEPTVDKANREVTAATRGKGVEVMRAGGRLEQWEKAESPKSSSQQKEARDEQLRAVFREFDYDDSGATK